MKYLYSLYERSPILFFPTQDNGAGGIADCPNIAQYVCFYLCKVDADTGGRLCGAAFTLRGPDGQEQTSVSDCSGRIRFHALPGVEYVLSETAPPSGYCLPAEHYTVRFRCDGKLLLNGRLAECVKLSNTCKRNPPPAN